VFFRPVLLSHSSLLTRSPGTRRRVDTSLPFSQYRAIDMPDVKPENEGKPAPSKKQQKADEKKAKTEKKKSDKGKGKGNK
jgi:hypothetical protein